MKGVDELISAGPSGAHGCAIQGLKHQFLRCSHPHVLRSSGLQILGSSNPPNPQIRRAPNLGLKGVILADLRARDEGPYFSGKPSSQTPGPWRYYTYSQNRIRPTYSRDPGCQYVFPSNLPRPTTNIFLLQDTWSRPLGVSMILRPTYSRGPGCKYVFPFKIARLTPGSLHPGLGCKYTSSRKLTPGPWV